MHSRIQYCFSIHGLGKEVWWSFALERAQWFILLHNFGVQFISFKLGKLKLLWMGEKVKLNVSTKAVTRGCKLWPLKEQFKEQFEWMSLKFVQFSHTSSISCSICSNLPLYQVIFKCYFKNHCFQLQQNVLWTNEMTRVIIVSGGLNGVSLAHCIS